MADDLDFSNLDGVDSIDWSDVEAELQQNKEMIKSEAADAGPGFDAGETAGDQVSAPSDVSVDFLMDIPLKLRVEVGTCSMFIKDVLKLNYESIVELNKNIGQPMDILINNKLVARGEVIIQNEKFGLRITEIMAQEERLDALKF